MVLVIRRPDSSSSSMRYGLFGVIGAGGLVKNLNLEDVSFISTNNYVGGIAGQNKGTIENCIVSGTIQGLQAGGITGNNAGTIKSCLNLASVKGNGSMTQAGGIAGNNSTSGGKIINSINTGDVSYTGFLGGIVGNSGGTVIACYSTGSLKNGQTATGGIAGFGNSNNFDSNYWASNCGAANGIGSTPSNTNAEPVDGIWNMAMEAMNAALAENGIEYQYIENEDSATKDSLPLIIVAK